MTAWTFTADNFSQMPPLNDNQAKAAEAMRLGSIENFVGATDWSQSEKQILDAFLQLSKDPELRESFQEALAEEMNKPETRSFLDRELAKLTETVSFIKEQFAEVAASLSKFDAQKFRKKKADGSAGGERVEPLLPSWRQFQQTFETLIHCSKKTAVDGVSQAKRYRVVILEMAANAAEMKDAILEVEGYRSLRCSQLFQVRGLTLEQDIDKLSKESEGISIQLDKLCAEISYFKVKMAHAIEESGSSDCVVDKEIQDVKKKITKVAAELTKYQKMATVGCLITAVGAGAVGLGIASITPLGWLAAAVGALAIVGGAVVYKLETDRKRTELKALDNQLQALLRRKGVLEELKSLVQKADKQIVHVCDSIGTIARIWAIFHMDATVLKRALESSITSRTPKGLIRQIKMAQDQYAALEANLEVYATKLT